ncbi:MAG: polyprenyl synthetase family protein [Clostridia bacterium]|nr:polyprenyl synthetase family protein [Clostridia bacterium]
MSNFNYNAVYQLDVDLINNRLNKLLSEHSSPDNTVYQAISYNILNGGKRLRPVLALEFCKACGKNPERALSFACAVELIHSSSLIQDDLPAMDNASMRRGQPACHIKFGESVAILASDALSVMAFELILSETSVGKISSLNATRTLINAVGFDGLVGGQTLDINNQNNPIDITALKKIYYMKTEVLFNVAAELGCIAAGANKKKIVAAKKYAQKIGLAFQIIDDILDVTATSTEIGKIPMGDIERKKTTFPSLIGLEESMQLVSQLTQEAIDALEPFNKKRTDFLIEFASSLKERQY